VTAPTNCCVPYKSSAPASEASVPPGSTRMRAGQSPADNPRLSGVLEKLVASSCGRASLQCPPSAGRNLSATPDVLGASLLYLHIDDVSRAVQRELKLLELPTTRTNPVPAHLRRPGAPVELKLLSGY
jgi:hypothetical protein